MDDIKVQLLKRIGRIETEAKELLTMLHRWEGTGRSARQRKHVQHIDDCDTDEHQVPRLSQTERK